MDSRQRIEAGSIPVPWTGCWLWERQIGSHGYGVCENTPAQRVSFRAFIGPIPDGLFVCHTCNVRTCVNPAHLYAGTHMQNMDDVSRGNYHPMRKLAGDEVRAIRASTLTQRELAELHGVHQRTIWQALHGRTYRHE